MTELADLHLDTSHLDTLTEEERHHAKALLKATLPLTDLQLFSANVFGVSRKHAVLEKAGRHIMLTDLHSSNGTRLNGTVLLSLQRRILRDGDEVQLGKLRLIVKFCRSQKGN
jgi:pSer/pThr/pTyr-binding forkhead associated (FHA) protein